MGEIIWTYEAERWLKDIYDFIAQDDSKAALQVILGIYERAQILSKFPEIGYRYEQHIDRRIRILLHGHYRIAYLIEPNKNITILGVFHGALEIGRYLF